MEKIMAETDLKKLREEERGYPYICIRPMTSVFIQLPIEPCRYSQLTLHVREVIITSVSYEAKTRKYRSCVIFSEDDCVYCEVDGQTWQSNEPPCRGINFVDLKSLVAQMQQRTIEEGFGLSQNDIGIYS